MGTQRKRGCKLTEIGYCKLITTLTTKEIKRRNWASWIQEQTEKIGEDIGDDTIRKILNKESVDETSIKSVFNALELLYQSNTDIILPEKCSDVTIPQSTITLSVSYQNLPRPDYQSFIGREAEIKELLTYLAIPNNIIGVHSISGTGKTTLVLEAAYRCLEAAKSGTKNQGLPIFEAIIFTSAKQQRFHGKGLSQCLQRASKKEDIVKKIAEVINASEINNIVDFEEKVFEVYKRLENLSTLLIIDNLETLEDKEDIDSLLYELPPSVTIVITSREQTLLQNVIHLKPLKEKDTSEFIESKAKELKITLSDQEKTTIYETTGGMPGAIMYALGLVRCHYDINVVLSQLKQPDQDINKFWFEAHLQQIRNQPAYYLLMALAMFPKSANFAAIIHVGLPETDTSIISDGLAILQQLLLINKEDERFVISLPLTRSYVFGELENNPEFETQARERWINWYLEYSHKYGRQDEKEWNEYKYLEEEWENLQDVIEWCIEQDRYNKFLQLWRNINGYSHAKGYYESDRTTAWQNRLSWINWLIDTARQQKKWDDLAELIFDKARTVTLMGNNLKQAKSLFAEVWKLSRNLDKNIDFQLQIVSHIVYLRWKELKVYQANLWLKLSEKLMQNANFTETTANRHQFYIFYFRGKISEYHQNYDRAITYYHQALNLAEALNWQRAISIVKNWLGDVKVQQGNFSEAKLILDECLDIAEKNNDKCRAAFCKESLAFLAEKNGNLPAARELAELAHKDFVSLGMLTEAAETQAFIQRIK
ncbi:NB-ARC domain-containing protein [Anabaena lutea]|uniref:AAA+ ATPase domain-containing protein n=1 Tax=Anabaena lutea FACHB-196 TaxID=2692881 RepID=A0ABR8FC47_9NOST|nr:NB-ARC domain-containing protein [Anabaena lutea]MBD2567792.1 hypothetical protein [Anabaena lutea FACHB-196]